MPLGGLAFESFPEDLFEFFDLGRDDERTIALARVGVVVILVVILCRPELLERNNFRHYRPRPDASALQLHLITLRQLLLLLIVIKDDGSVLCPDIVSLPVPRSGIVSLPKDFQKLIISNLFGIVGDLTNLCMPGCTTTDLLVGGMLHMAARVSGDNLLNSCQPMKDSLDAPETTGPERRLF